MPAPRVTAFLNLDAKQFNETMAAAQRNLRVLAERMEAVASRARVVFAAIGGAVGVAVKQAAEDLESQQRLAIALDVTGQKAVVFQGRLEKATQQMAAQTRQTDDAIRSTMAYGLSLGLTADQTVAATRGAIGLSAALGTDLQAGMKLMTQATNENFTMLSKYLPQLKNAKTESEKMAIVQAFASRSYEIAKRSAETYVGSIVQMQKAVGELGESVGNTLLPGLGKIADVVKNAANALREYAEANDGAVAKTITLSLAVTGLLSVSPQILRFLADATLASQGMAKAFAALATGTGSVALVLGGLAAAGLAAGAIIADLESRMGRAEDQSISLNNANRKLGEASIKFNNAKTLDEQIAAMQEMIRASEAAAKNPFMRGSDSFFFGRTAEQLREELALMEQEAAAQNKTADAVSKGADYFNERFKALQDEYDAVFATNAELERRKAINAGASPDEANALAMLQASVDARAERKKQEEAANNEHKEALKALEDEKKAQQELAVLAAQRAQIEAIVTAEREAQARAAAAGQRNDLAGESSRIQTAILKGDAQGVADRIAAGRRAIEEFVKQTELQKKMEAAMQRVDKAASELVGKLPLVGAFG